tara:strand:+ start:235 stop:522 length:288 start_codon:yes stop_codon:yes gene_type:complete
MSCLHTINKTPHVQLLESCIDVINKEDAVIFIEDGVYHCIHPRVIEKLSRQNECYGLKEDLLARGITEPVENLKVVNYKKFVDLCCTYEKIISWF